MLYPPETMCLQSWALCGPQVSPLGVSLARLNGEQGIDAVSLLSPLLSPVCLQWSPVCCPSERGDDDHQEEGELLSSVVFVWSFLTEPQGRAVFHSSPLCLLHRGCLNRTWRVSTSAPQTQPRLKSSRWLSYMLCCAFIIFCIISTMKHEFCQLWIIGVLCTGNLPGFKYSNYVSENMELSYNVELH